MKYDYLVVGAGMFGSVFAREMTDAGAKCLVIDKRDHIGGNCYTEDKEGIHVHKYGPHVFHTNNKGVWDYVNKWSEFNSYKHRIRVSYESNIYSFPINLMTLYQLWGVRTPGEAQKKLDEVRIPIENPSNLEEWMLSQEGEEIYEKFVKGYTTKQWGREPKKLPKFIIQRLPIRKTYDDCYFNDRYQGIPSEGYTKIFNNLLKGISVDTGVDYLKDSERLDKQAKRIVYTGAIDEFFECDMGVLGGRGLKFEEERVEGDYQGVSIMNYTEESVPYTRIIEHKHFCFGKQDFSYITKEYPSDWSAGEEKFYPVNDETNNSLYSKYKSRIGSRYILGGRLAEYMYYDMHQVIGSALKRSKGEIKCR